MLMLISPAKKLDFATSVSVDEYTIPQFKEEVFELVANLQKLSKSELAQLMKLSDKLAELNFHRYQNFEDDFNMSNSKPAIYAFKGDTYVGLDADSFSEEDIKYASEHLRILSGLYGLLRPLDLMQPYRLEMGTKFPNNKGEDLYDFWQGIITDSLNSELEQHSTKILLNLASNEYIKAINKSSLQAKFVTAHFKVIKNGVPKTIGIFAKRARGSMARYIIKNKIDDIEAIKEFSIDGYKYQNDLSDSNNIIFIK